jgi:hypothetical protein
MQRITIEMEGGPGAAAEAAPEPGRVAAVDAGAPSESLVQTMETGTGMAAYPTVSRPERAGAMDGGPPPEWLLQAIEGAKSPGVVAPTGATDGGAAPA